MGLYVNAKTILLGIPQQQLIDQELKPLPLTSKLLNINNKNYHEKRVSELAEHYNLKLEAYLKKYPTREIKEALEDPFIYEEVRNFLRNEGNAYKDLPAVKKCKQLHLAAKLGINPEILHANHGFEHYASQSLERYLLVYEDKIVLEGDQISLKFKGKYTPWKEIHETMQGYRHELCDKLGIDLKVLNANHGFEKYAAEHIETLRHVEKKIDEKHHLSLKFEGKFIPWKEYYEKHRQLRYHWSYDKEGVQWQKDFFVFDKLEPMFIKENKDKVDLIEICACESVKTWMAPITGVHVWFRIITADGEIYPLGLYRPAKLSEAEHLDFALRTKQAFFGYEITEFWPLKENEDIRTIKVQITPEQRDQMLAQFEADAKRTLAALEDCDEEPVAFQISQKNCVAYAAGLLKKFTGKVLPTEQSIFGLFNPKRFKLITDKIPAIIRKILVAISTPFINLLQLCLGIHLVDKSIKNRHVKPIIASIRDFFTPAKALGHHPYTIMTKTFEWVEKWRKEEAVRLEKAFSGDELKEKLRLLKFQIPPQEALPSYY